MIKLDLITACHSCSHFEPVKAHERAIMYEGNVIEIECDITCANICKCRSLLAHLQKEVKKDGN